MSVEYYNMNESTIVFTNCQKNILKSFLQEKINNYLEYNYIDTEKLSPILKDLIKLHNKLV